MLIGTKQQQNGMGFSDEAFKKALEFKPRPSDCFVITPPKTGTTLLQFACHLLRSAVESSNNQGQEDLEYWSKKACDFEDLYQVSPWAMMAWDIGVDITDKNYEQKCPPDDTTNQIFYPVRVFKSHQRLAAINPGAKYIVTVRDPKSLLVSRYNFLKNKKVPFVLKYETVSEFAIFHQGCLTFPEGGSLWEYYRDYLTCMKYPNVLVVVFEDLIKDIRGHLPALSRFMGLDVSKEYLDKIATLCSKENMINNVTKFDESWTSWKLKAMKRFKDADNFHIAARVTSGAGSSILDQKAIAFLDECWKENMGNPTGFQSYQEFAQIIRKEYSTR